MASTPNENTVFQANVDAGRDVAGRDINNYSYGASHDSLVAIQALYEKFENEVESNPQLSEFIAELQDYNRPIVGNVLGLEEKLTRAKHESFIDLALRQKEAYSKLLAVNQFSPVAQQLHVYLLALVEDRFMSIVYPKLCEDASIAEIQELMHERIVNPILEELGINTMGITAAHIRGMVYMLTGNCHLKWEK